MSQSMEVCKIVDLNLERAEWVIRCRVTRKVPPTDYANDRGKGKVITVDLEDASGEIRGVAFNKLAHKVNFLLEVGKDYDISGEKGCLKPADDSYNDLDHEFEIYFDKNARIRKVGGNFVRLSEVQVPLNKDRTQSGSNSGRKRPPEQSASSPKRKQNTPPGSNSGRKCPPEQSASSPKRELNTPPEYASESPEDKALNKLNISFVVMTANKNEYTAALNYLKQSPKSDPSLKDVEKPKTVSHSNYVVFNVAGKQGILMQCTNMGSFTRKGSNWHTFKLLNEARKHHWPLEVIFIVGCCGAHSTDGNNIPEGTILVAESIQQYLIGKMEVDGVHYKPNRHPIPTENEWIEYIQIRTECESNPKYTIKAFEKCYMCSGDFVIKDDQIAKELCGSQSIIGFEMEGFGVISAIDVYRSIFLSKGEEVPDVVLVKGVSDNAGGDKNKPKNCLHFSENLADVNEDTRQCKCTEMSLSLVLRAMIGKWKE